MLSVLVLDAGNSLIKYTRGDGQEGQFAHALKELTATDIKHIKDRNGQKLPDGYAVVNGKSYAYGETAERYGAVNILTRAARYTPDYYGVFAAITLGLSYNRGGSYALFGSHAPGDVDYRENLMRAALGVWEVEIEGKTRTYKIEFTNTFDEPQGGLFNVILAEDGQHYAHSDINGGRALVIDIGGKTTDWLAVNPGGEVDYSLQESTNAGILDVIANFEKSFRSRYAAELQDTPDLPPARVREAIRTGVFRARGRELDCQNEVAQSVNLLLNRIANAYKTKAGGGIDFDSIILTGGGPGTLENHLRPILAHEHVLLADDAAKIHLANVRGGRKLWKFYEAEGLLD